MNRRPAAPAAPWLAIGMLAFFADLAGMVQATPPASESTSESAVLQTLSPQQFTTAAKAPVTAAVRGEDPMRVFSVGSDGTGNAPILIHAGLLKVQPRTAYRLMHRFRPDKLEAPANLRLMIREHEAPQSRPIQPYHQTSTTLRAVPVEKTGTWLQRQESFVTGEKTHVLSVAIVIADLKGEIALGAVELLDEAKAQAADAARHEADRRRQLAESEQIIQELQAQAARRQPLTVRPLVFSRAQMKYGLERNYYHQWNDRPLRVSREFRVPSPYAVVPGSYQQILKEVAQYRIDGLAFFPETSGRMSLFEAHPKVAKQAGIEGVGLLPEFLGAFTPDHVQVKSEIIRRALDNPYCPRIDGKRLITSYGAQSLKPDQWASILKNLRDRHGDRFVFLPALTFGVSLIKPFREGEPITREQVEQEKQALREYLEVCDGIYFNYPPALTRKDRSFDDRFYREVFIPLYQSVLAEPKYRNKYLGLSAYKSHMSPDRGNNLHEDYTATLRHSFQCAMDARPDVILLPEWDEVNENTSFRPSVYGANTTQRILRYYMSRIRGEAPTPVPGDDPGLPNLILSTRKCLTLGEDLIVELVHVPDTAESRPYTAQVTLLDENGAAIRTFEPVGFDAATMSEHRFCLPTREIPDVRAVVPVLSVRGYRDGGEQVFDQGWHHVQIRATWNWDYLAVKQPLRDLLRASHVRFAWAAAEQAVGADGNGARMIEAAIEAPEPLALVEVLGDDDEAYAYDPNDEFFRAAPDRTPFLIEYRAINEVNLNGSVRLNGASGHWLATGDILHRPENSATIHANRVELQARASANQRWLYLALANADLEAAELVFDLTGDQQIQFAIPIREVLKKQMISRSFADGLSFTVSPYRRQIDMPVHLDQPKASFRVAVWPEIASEQYHLRLTSKSGKIFRSRPLLLPLADPQRRQTLRVYSQAERGPADLSVAAERIPALRYDFDPERGAVLWCDAGRPFWASLGGYTNTTTGRGTANGLLRGVYPKQSDRSAPIWEQADGRPCLRFDGKGTYLELPREAVPSRGSFTLEFEVKLASARNQVLLANRMVNGQKGLVLLIEDGKLQGRFFAADWQMHALATDLAVPAGAWSKIRVRHDFEKMVLAVGGQEASFPVSQPAFNISFTMLGEGWRGNWFDGQMREIRIVHNAFSR